MRLVSILTVAGAAILAQTQAVSAFSINDAIQQAVKTHPGVGEAAANRRATESELRQTQSTLLPQVRVEGRVGPERFLQDITPRAVGAGDWRNGRQVSLTVRQLIFDGFTTINEIWRQSYRTDAAAHRVLERTELLALDAAEAYIDVVRFMRAVTIAQDNLSVHRRIFSNVRARFEGGRAGEGDMQQARERVEAADAAYAEFRRSLDEAKAKYRRAVGLEPHSLTFPGRLRGLPPTKDESLAVALRHNPTIRAAESDALAAKYGFRATSGAFLPTVTLEGRATAGVDSDTFIGRREDYSGKIVASWDVFRGGQDTWRRNEMAERYTEQTMRHARLQRDAFESLEKAWGARTITNDRIAALTRQIDADRKTITAYEKEYELGQRSLIDLLNAQNQLFNASVSLTSARGVAVFADYQLLAAMGQLTEYLKAPLPVDAAPLDHRPFGIFPTKLPPILIREPRTGPEPLNIFQPTPMGAPASLSVRAEAVPANPAAEAVPANPPEVMKFSERWSRPGAANAGLITGIGTGSSAGTGAVTSFAPAREGSGLPFWIGSLK